MMNIKLLIQILPIIILFSCSKDNEFEYALIQTGDVTNIDSTGATFHARISDLGKTDILEYGFVWGVESDPNINSSKSIFIDNPQIGIISEKITNDIFPDTIYYVRAYAKSDSYITYGKIVTFRSEGSLSPEIVDFSPKEGTNNTKVTIMGNNFSGGLDGNIVMFGKAKAQIESASINKIVVTLPSDLNISGVVNISIKVANHRIVSDSTFYLEGIIIHDFTPKEVIGGEYISIYAKNYSPNIADNILYIGSNKADIIKIENDSILAYVPYNADFGENEVSLSTNNKTCFSNYSLKVNNPWNKIVNNYSFYRNGAIGFSIGNFGYVGLGVNTNNNMYYTPYKDLWKYNFNENTWKKCSDLPDKERESAISFSISGKGYICLGHYAGWEFFNDLYAYNPNNDTWEKKSDFPGDARRYSFSLVIGNKAYVGLGSIGDFEVKNDFWEYDPVFDKWTRLADYPSSGGNQVVGFSVNNKGYIGLGTGENVYPVQKDFWEYDPSKDNWKKLADFPGTERRLAVGFALGEYGYIGFGWKASGYGGVLNDVWRYDVKSDRWSRIADCPYKGRYESVSFVNNNQAYICSGVNDEASYGNHKESLIVLNPNK